MRAAASITEPGAGYVRSLATGAAPGQEVLCRARNFLVSWVQSDETAPSSITADTEYMLLLPDVGASIAWDQTLTLAPPRSVVIVPAGMSVVSLAGQGRAIRLCAPVPPAPAAAHSLPDHLAGDGPALRPPLPGFRRIDECTGVIVHALADYPNSPNMPRARLFQSETMSINWVEYQGPRDRGKLSPHAHTDFEQGSLALAGRFIHHLRTPWSADANAWVDDAHIVCEADTLAVIPPPIEHTTEGIGDELHVLIDIFAPPRRDFIDRGQILNSRSYRAPATGGG